MERRYCIGAHMSVACGFQKMFADATAIGSNTMQFFLRNPRGGKAKKTDADALGKFHALLQRERFGKIVVHAPYTMNLCSPKEETRLFGMEMMAEDLRICEYFPGNYYNFHPGCAVGQPPEAAIAMISDALNRVLFSEMQTTVLLETMAGKGSEIGRSFAELRKILDGVQLAEKTGVCLDTCHVWDAGYDIARNLDAVLDEFDREIGIARLRAVHINDSMNSCGSRKDRHALIGQGCIGTDALVALMEHPVLRELPFLLETPTDDAGHGAEIKMLRNLLDGAE